MLSNPLKKCIRTPSKTNFLTAPPRPKKKNQCFYFHQLRDSVSPVGRIFNKNIKKNQLLNIIQTK